MARKTKKPEPDKPAKIPDKLARPFAEAMRAMKDDLANREKEAEEAKKAEATRRPEPVAPRAAPARTPRKTRSTDPVADYGYDDRTAFHQAFADVRPLAPKEKNRASGQTAPISPEERRERAAVAARLDEAEASARARLEALVAGSAKFVVERDDDAVYGRRTDVADRTIDVLLAIKAAPRASIDLHGLDAKAARTEVVARLREEAKHGAHDVIVIHGKGLHSDDGRGVLAEVVFDALVNSAASPHVGAFATAPMRFGGSGATLVRLVPRSG